MRKKNDEAKLEIYEVEAMADTVRKDFVSGFIAGAFIGSAVGFILNQVKKRKQQEKQFEEKFEQDKPSMKEKVSAQTDALKANAQDQLQGMKDVAQQIRNEVAQKIKDDEQEYDVETLRAEKQAIRNEAASHDLADVSPKAQEEVSGDSNASTDSKDDVSATLEFTASGNAKAAKEKAKLIENDNTVAAKVSELFKEAPVKSSAFATVPVLVTVTKAVAESDKKADTKTTKPEKSKSASKAAPKPAEKRTNQTHEKASMDKGVITHDKATANHATEGKNVAGHTVVIAKKDDDSAVKVAAKEEGQPEEKVNTTKVDSGSNKKAAAQKKQQLRKKNLQQK